MAASTDAKPAHSLLKKKRTSDVLSSENANVDFASLMLSPPVEKGLASAGFERPSPIQLKAIPLGRCGLDLIVQAKSGTGKTCVFSVIALESIIASSNSLQILILAPTREIAIQIQDVIQAIGCAIEGLKCHAFIGGTIFGQDRQNLKKCHIAVGTPGRIKQLIEYDVMKTDSVRLFILDEADKLLDEKFQASVNWIYHQLPENKQMLALSATYPESLAQQLTNYMRDPTFVRLNPRDLTLQGIKQFYKIVPGHDLPHKAFQIKADVLVDLLSQIAFNQCLIFSNLQSRAQNLCDVLLERGWPATFISGNQEQGDRMKAMAELKSYKCRILISTDLTARGIDAENVNLIINLDVSKDFKTYLHRIGRAGRFGTHGAAITLASEGSEVNLLQTVQKKSGSNIKLLPDLLPSNLLELSFHEVETEVLFTPESETLNNDSGDIIELLSSSKNDSIDSKNLEDTYRHETLVSANDDEKEAKIKSPNFEKGKTEDSLQGRESSEVAWQNDEEKEAGSQHRDLSTRKKDEDDIHRETDSPRDRNPSWSMRNELQDWMVPMAILQQVKETRRQPWQWDDVVRLFEDGECGSEKEVDNKSTNDVRGLKYHSTGDIIKHDEDIERSVRSCQLSGLETTLDSEQLYSQTMSRECGRSKAENIDEFGHPGDSDILAEFKAVRDLLEKFKMEEAVIEEQASSQSLAREDDDVDQDSSKLDKRKLKACSESLQLNGYSSIHFKRKTEVLDCQNRKEIVEREEFQQDMGITDRIDHGADTLDDNSGRNGKRNLSAQRNVTENFSFCKEDKTAKKRQSNLMKNARQYNVAHLEGKRQSLNDSSTYEACVGDGASRMRLQDQQNSDEEKSIHQNTSSRNNDKWFQFHSQECRSSDNIWEYFKFVARINSQSMFPPQGKNSLEQGKEDTAQIQKGRNSVLKVENDLKSCTVNNREDDETNKANSEQSSGSMEDSHDPLTSDYSEEHNQFTETGNCSTNADQYRLSYGLSNSGNRSERSTVNSESNSIPEFAGTIEDIPDPTADCSEEGAYFQYWMGNCNGAEGWGNSYGTASVLWDGQTTHCNQQFTPHYYESFYPYV